MPSSTALRLRSGLVLSALLLSAYPTGASAADEDDYFTELPVVLSVTRLAQPINETPGAVTVLDRETIRRSGARELADLLRLVLGFIIYHPEGPLASYHAICRSPLTGARSIPACWSAPPSLA